MSFLNIENIKIQGVTVCIPKEIEENEEYEVIPSFQRSKFIEAIGIERRRIATEGLCTSDLCYKAAKHLIDKLGWSTDSIDLLVFISQTPDYKMPATSCLLQNRLQLPTETMTIDISQGCSGYVYGLGVVGSLMQTGNLKRCLLLVGNTQSRNLNYKDKSVYPLFSDAGSATAIEFSPTNSDILYLSYGTDGSGEFTIYIPDGGYRNGISEESFKEYSTPEGLTRNRLNLVMKGDDVFSFVISKIPKFTQNLIEHFNLDFNTCDYYLIHHASWFLIKKLIKKLGIPVEKAPVLLKDFGNISNVSIPLLLTSIAEELKKGKLKLYITGFGVGLSLGVGIIEIGPIKTVDLIEY